MLEPAMPAFLDSVKVLSKTLKKAVRMLGLKGKAFKIQATPTSIPVPVPFPVHLLITPWPPLQFTLNHPHYVFHFAQAKRGHDGARRVMGCSLWRFVYQFHCNGPAITWGRADSYWMVG